MSGNSYIVTDDLSLLLPRLGINLDEAAIELSSKEILNALSAIYRDVQVIPGKRMKEYLTEKVRCSNLPVISMTDILPLNIAQGSLEFSRSIKLVYDKDEMFFENIGIQKRKNSSKGLSSQFNDIYKKISGTDVAIVDDVVWSGSSILGAANNLKTIGISVKKVFANVVIGAGRDSLQNAGIEVEADQYFDEVVDEVCARDFLVGIPGGGRNVLEPRWPVPFSPITCKSAPYIYPFGAPQSWASIPAEFCSLFSQRMLGVSREMWTSFVQKNPNISLNKHILDKEIVFWPDRISGIDMGSAFGSPCSYVTLESIPETLRFLEMNGAANAPYANLR
jgi:hypothetical protein